MSQKGEKIVQRKKETKAWETLRKGTNTYRSIKKREKGRGGREAKTHAQEI